MTESGDDTLLVELLEELRRELREHRALLQESIEQGRTFERHMDTQMLALNQRINELEDDLELTIRSELIGLLAGFDINGSSGG